MTEQLCKKISFKDNDGKTINLLGIIEEEDDFLLTFATSKNRYRISKENILKITDTTVIFKKELPKEQGFGESG